MEWPRERGGLKDRSVRASSGSPGILSARAVLRGRQRGEIVDRQDDGDPQHVRALERANQVRAARATVKRRIASGELAAGEVILSHRWEIEKMQVAEILISQPQW